MEVHSRRNLRVDLAKVAIEDGATSYTYGIMFREWDRYASVFSALGMTGQRQERVRRLEKLGLMTDAGRAVLPKMGPRSFRVDPDIERALKDARCWSKFKSLPPLYQRVRAGNPSFYKTRDSEAYSRMLGNLVVHTKRGETYGEWNDYGRLLEY